MMTTNQIFTVFTYNFFMYIIRPYQNVMEYRDKFCTPKPIKDCVVTENELIVPIQDIIHHDLGKIFHLEPDLFKEIETIKERSSGNNKN